MRRSFLQRQSLQSVTKCTQIMLASPMTARNATYTIVNYPHVQRRTHGAPADHHDQLARRAHIRVGTTAQHARSRAHAYRSPTLHSSTPPFTTLSPLNHSTTSPLHHSATSPPHHSTTPPLHHYTTLPLSRAPLLHHPLLQLTYNSPPTRSAPWHTSRRGY